MKITGFCEGGIEYFELSKNLIDNIAKLNGVANDYIAMDESILMVNITRLYPTRMRERGILSANKKMLEVWNDARGKRVPLSVKEHPIEPSSYCILDGNSTFFNFLISEFETIPVKFKS